MTPQVTAQDAVGDKITLTSVSQTMVDAGQVATSDNALTAFRGGHLKVVGGVSHMGERTLGLCLSSLAAMTDPLADVVLASGLTPMCASFNACLDFACDTNADILFHTASDVVVDPRALTALLEVMDLSQNYLAVARGHDPMFGDDTSVGIWIWNMRIMKRDFRFNDVFKQDLDLCERVEAATGKTRVYTPYGMRLGRHHPIWTPEELYAKFVYSYPKHNARRKKHMRDFLDRGLAANPLNKALIAGRVGLARADSDGIPKGSKDSETMAALFQKDCSDLHLDGTEYYCDRQEFMDYAMNALGSYKSCVVPDLPPQELQSQKGSAEGSQRPDASAKELGT